MHLVRWSACGWTGWQHLPARQEVIKARPRAATDRAPGGTWARLLGSRSRLLVVPPVRAGLIATRDLTSGRIRGCRPHIGVPAELSRVIAVAGVGPDAAQLCLGGAAARRRAPTRARAAGGGRSAAAGRTTGRGTRGMCARLASLHNLERDLRGRAVDTSRRRLRAHLPVVGVHHGAPQLAGVRVRHRLDVVSASRCHGLLQGPAGVVAHRLFDDGLL